MNLNINLERIHEKCRICLKIGDINIWNSKVNFKQQYEKTEDKYSIDVMVEKSFFEIIDIFSCSQDLLNFTEEFPLLCLQCLEDLKLCYMTYEKMKQANTQLQSLWQESINQCIEEEHLVEVADETDLIEIRDTSVIGITKDNDVNPSQLDYGDETDFAVRNKAKKTNPDNSDSFIVTQFVSETLETPKTYTSNKKDEKSLLQLPQHLRTVNLKAIAVKDVKNLERLESLQSLAIEKTENAVYMCQYCPQAFAKSDYLKTHVQKCHVCKFCTQSFSVMDDLFRHIREVHIENKCAICHKILSSRTNLRHHIKRVHQIKLPAKVTLLDFIKSASAEENKEESDLEMMQEERSPATDLNTQFMWTNYEIFSEDNNELN